MDVAYVELSNQRFRLRNGEGGEDRFVVEPVEENYNPMTLRMVRTYANLHHPELEKGHIPHKPAAAGRLVESHLRELGAKFVSFGHEPPPGFTGDWEEAVREEAKKLIIR